MSRDQLMRARDLILAKRYGEARSILNAIDHPTAREWLTKIDQIESTLDLGDPFAEQSAPQAPMASARLDLLAAARRSQASPRVSAVTTQAGAQLLSESIAVFAQKGWKIKIQTDNTAQFEKKKPVNFGLALILAILLGVLGVVIVTLAAATSGSEQVTLQAQSSGGLKAISRDGTEEVTTTEDLKEIAQSVGGSIDYGIILLIGIGSTCLGWVLLSGMSYHY